ncbi:MAG: class I SAM-dependent methyltransferase [Wenzhouxiangella sp.]
MATPTQSDTPGLACLVCEQARARPFMTVDGRAYWRCDHCLATFLDPAQQPTLAAERAEYDLHQNHPDDPGYRRFLAQLATPMLAELKAASDGLDFGCGPGPALHHLLEAEGHRLTLWDPLYFPNPQALERDYDFVTATEVVEHFHRPAESFRLLDRLLRPGGMLGLMTRLQTDDARFAGWHYRRDPTHVVFYRAETLRLLAGQHGWEVMAITPAWALFRKPT